MLDDLSLKDSYTPPPTIQTSNPTELRQLNLDSELLENYQNAKNYLQEVRFSEDTSPSQVAQVMNTISSILREIVKTQTELYNAERIKAIESCLISTLKTLPEETQDEFFQSYEDALKAIK